MLMQFKILDKIVVKTGVLVVLEKSLNKIHANNTLKDKQGNIWLVCGEKRPNIEQYNNQNQAFLLKNERSAEVIGDFLILNDN